MKKRLRKKLHVGEFTDLCFTLSGKLKAMDEETEDRFFTSFFGLAGELGFCLEGTIGGGEIDLEVITGQAGFANEERREAFLTGLKELQEIEEFDASTIS